MALNIVRHDITKIKADAIVNSTNEYFDVGGLGVDASIHYAAGPDLKDALSEIGYCPVGSSVVTGSFNIPTCKYIIHAVAPVYKKGDVKEKVFLRKTYHSILRHASEYKCKSVAIPLLSAGANGYERDADKLAWALREDIMLHAYMFTMSGIPVLYSGDEIAQENDYGYHDDPLKAADSRFLHRGNLDWEAAERRHDPESVEGQVFQSLRALERLRAEHRVFDGAADTWIVDTRDDGVLGIGRYYKGEKLVGLFNFAESEKRVCVNELGEYHDLLSGEAVDKFAVTLPAGGFVWMLCDFGQED